MSKKEDTNWNLIQVLQYASQIKVTPEKIESNARYISDNNGGSIIL